MQLPQLLVLLVFAEREAGQRGATGKHARVLSLGLSLQPFYMFWKQVLVVFRGNCAGLKETSVRNRSMGDAGHQKQEILSAGQRCKVAIMPSLRGKLQIARLLPVFVLLLWLVFCIALCIANHSHMLLLFHLNRADVWLMLSW